MNPNELPQAAKQESGKSKAKNVKRPRTDSVPLVIKTPMLNPAWAAEVVKALGIGGPIAQHVATTVGQEIEALLTKVTSSAKLTKLARTAFNKNVGRLGNP